MSEQFVDQAEQSNLNTTPAEQLMVMLYDSTIRSIGEAKDCLESDDLRRRAASFDRAQRLLLEIEKALRSGRDPKISVHQIDMHEQCLQKFIRARIYLAAQALDEATDMLLNMRDTWKQIDGA